MVFFVPHASSVQAPQTLSEPDASDPLADGALRALAAPWPAIQLRRRFSALVEKLLWHWAESENWPAAIAHLNGELASLGALNPGDALHNQLRLESAAISMTVHLRPIENGARGMVLANLRRRRTRYASYPTPPAVAELMARWLASVVPSDVPVSIVDPTIEGSPLLLEVSRIFAPRRNVELLGIDRDAAAILASTQLFKRAKNCSKDGYVEPRLKTGNAFKLLSEARPFDAVLSNPPWGEHSLNSEVIRAGSYDPFVAFVKLGLSCLKEGGAFAFVLPGQMVAARVADELRGFLTEQNRIDAIITLPKACFPRATVRSVIILGRKGRGLGELTSLAHVDSNRDFSVCRRTVRQSQLGGREPWWPCIAVEPRPRYRVPMVPLGEIAEVRTGLVPYRRGDGRPPQSDETLRQRPFTFDRAVQRSVPVVASRGVATLVKAVPTEFVLPGPHLAFSGDHFENRNRPRIFLREICGRDGRLVCGIGPRGAVPRYGVFSIAHRPSDGDFLLGAISCSVIARWVRTNCDGIFKESFNRIRVGDVRRLPIPQSLLDPHNSNRQELDDLVRSYRRARRKDKRDILALQIDTVMGAFFR